ncbi:MAG: hypothetical protein SCM96_03400 [Acidobacteriota bacterium]|nr:hypothetical protein [Acidobacteriota bacterium]
MMREKGRRPERQGGPGLAAAIIAAAALVFLVIERIFLHGGEYHHWWDGIPLFYGLFGGAGALILIFAAKSLVMRLIKRSESYYDRD